jgi:ankyrin repeat protein
MRVLRVWWMAFFLPASGFSVTGNDAQLLTAAEKDDRAAVRTLLDRHADANAAQADGSTALAWAAHWDDLEIADLLIRDGANVNAANDLGVTPLSLACTNASSAMVARLLQGGANSNTAQRSGETALMTCAGTGSIDAVKALLARGADVGAKETRRGQTALMWSVARKHPEVTQLLLQHGADINARSKSGFTPLMFAAQLGDMDFVRMLIAAGANVKDVSPEHGSALLVAAASGHEALAIFLLDQGADPNATDSDGMTPLHYALLKGLTQLLGLRLKLIQVSYMTRPNMTQLVKALLAHGANPNLRLARVNQELPTGGGWMINAVGATPFMFATACLDVSTMRLLLAGGANPLIAAKENTTPLMVAAGLGQTRIRTEAEQKSALEAAKIVVDLGVDVNAVDSSGQTALHGAAYTASDSIVQFLADKGAKLNVKDSYGMTPLSVAEGIIPPDLTDIDKNPKIAHKSTADLLRKLGATDSQPSGGGSASQTR